MENKYSRIPPRFIRATLACGRVVENEYSRIPLRSIRATVSCGRVVEAACIILSILLGNSVLYAQPQLDIISPLSSIFSIDQTVLAANARQPKKTVMTTQKQAAVKKKIAATTTDVASQMQRKVTQAIAEVTTNKPSALAERIHKENAAFTNPFSITFYKPTYLLPGYHTTSPYSAVYAGTTPDNQKIDQLEFKAQLSLKFPLLHNMLRYGSFYIGYTQLSYWQFYAKSQWFRETNYEPELFWSKSFMQNWVFNAGIVHQSNGRGGTMERSWNRAYVDLMFSGQRWLVSLRPWILIFKSRSSDLHNPDIDKYLGYGQMLFAYKYKNTVTSFTERNGFSSLFRRGAYEFDFSFPIHDYLHGYVQLFDGYGQSLIEYNHSTKAVGLGITLSNWI